MSGQKLAELASGFIDDWAAWHPSAATSLGYHRFDGHLPDWSAAALADEQRVDAAILANVIERRSSLIGRSYRPEFLALWDPGGLFGLVGQIALGALALAGDGSGWLRPGS